MSKLLFERIEALVKRCESFDVCSPDWRKLDDEINKEMDSIDNSVGSDLVPGRLLMWGVADGSAIYFVKKVGKRETVLIHLPYMDGYHFQGCYLNGKNELCVSTAVAERAGSFRATTKRMFA